MPSWWSLLSYSATREQASLAERELWVGWVKLDIDLRVIFLVISGGLSRVAAQSG